jgi:hypothetical protein
MSSDYELRTVQCAVPGNRPVCFPLISHSQISLSKRLPTDVRTAGNVASRQPEKRKEMFRNITELCKSPRPWISSIATADVSAPYPPRVDG